VARQLEDSKDADQAYDAEDGERHGVAAAGCRAFGVDQYGAEGHVVRDDGDQVDDVHEVLEEDDVIGAGGEAQRELRREPHDADRLYDEERFVGCGLFSLFCVLIRSVQIICPRCQFQDTPAPPPFSSPTAARGID